MHDVVIVGAGPVGLFLACELGLAGCTVLVLEREPELRSPWKAYPLGMRGLSAASVEAFYRRGMLYPLLTASGVDDDPGPNPDADDPSPPRGVGHFAGMMLDPAKVDVAALPFRLPGPALEGVMTNLEAVEAVLYDQASKLGVEVRRGATVSAIAQDDESWSRKPARTSTRRAGSSAAMADAARCVGSQASTSSAPSPSSPATPCTPPSPIPRSCALGST